jgi:L-aspartate oxidase
LGEVGCTGLHGANRLASNSLLEALVVAHRASIAVTAEKMPLQMKDLPPWESGPAQDPDELVVIYHNWREIRQLMWDYVGIVRTTKRLKRAASRLYRLSEEVRDYYWNYKMTCDLIELRNLVLVASLIVDSALSRRESRGLHYTRDFPETDTTHPPTDTVLQAGSSSA